MPLTAKAGALKTSSTPYWKAQHYPRLSWPSTVCRRRDLYPEQLRRWRVSCEQANARSQQISRQDNEALKTERKRSRDLERELRRKNAALAETAALLTLRKKAWAIWGDEEE